MVQLSILRDNREQKPWSFDGFDANVRDATINTGDYTLPQLCRHNEELDTYYPHFAVERKAGEDFAESITSNRDRFKKEIKRASDWECPLLVLIESPRRTFRRREGFMQYRDLTWKQVKGTIESWEKYYNVDFRYAGSRERAERIAYDELLSRLRAMLFSGG